LGPWVARVGVKEHWGHRLLQRQAGEVPFKELGII